MTEPMKEVITPDEYRSAPFLQGQGILATMTAVNMMARRETGDITTEVLIVASDTKPLLDAHIIAIGHDVGPENIQTLFNGTAVRFDFGPRDPKDFLAELGKAGYIPRSALAPLGKQYTRLAPPQGRRAAEAQPQRSL